MRAHLCGLGGQVRAILFQSRHLVAAGAGAAPYANCLLALAHHSDDLHHYTKHVQHKTEQGPTACLCG